MIFFKLTFVNSNSIDVDKSQLEGVAVNFFQTYMQDFCTWIKVKNYFMLKEFIYQSKFLVGCCSKKCTKSNMKLAHYTCYYAYFTMCNGDVVIENH